MERKRKSSLSRGEGEEDGDRRISPRKRTRVRYTENSHDDVEEEDDDEEEECEEEEEEEQGGTHVEEDDEEPGPSTSYYSNNKKNTNNTGFWTVTCGNKTGILDKAKLKKGAKCIKYDGRWFVPRAFENLGGKSSHKKWKATIFHENKPLQHWFEEGYLTCTRFKRGSAHTPKKTGSYISESSSKEEEETEDEHYRNENELSGSEEPERGTDERSSEAANVTSVEGSLQDTSRDKEDQMESGSVSAAATQELKAKPVRTCDRREVRVVLERLSEKKTRPNGDENQEKKEDNTSTLDDPSFTDAAHVDSSQMSGPSLGGGLKEERVEEFTSSSERKEKVEDESGNDSPPSTAAEELTQSSDTKETQTEKQVVKEEDETGIRLSLASTAEGSTPSSEREEAQKEKEVVVEEDDDKTANNSSPLTAAEELTQSSDRKEAQIKEVIAVDIEEEDKNANTSSPLSTEEEFTPGSESKEARIEEVVVVVIEEEDDDKIGNNSSPLTAAEGFSQSSDRKAQTEGEEEETGNNSSPVSTAEGVTQSSDIKEAVEEEEGEDGSGNNSSPVCTAASSGPDVAPDSEVVQSIDSDAANLSSPPGLFVTAANTSVVGDMKGRGEERGEDGPEAQSRCQKGFEECRNAYEGNILVSTAKAAGRTFTTGCERSWAAFAQKGLKKERVEDDPDMDSYDTTSGHDAAQPQPLKQDERAFQASRTPGTTHTCDTVPPASSRDLSCCDLNELRMEKMRMQIKVLKLQEEYYTWKIKALLKAADDCQ